MMKHLTTFLFLLSALVLTACGQIPGDQTVGQSVGGFSFGGDQAVVAAPQPVPTITFVDPLAGSYRMSSPFNPNRVHPVTGQVRPHTGTDWAAPSGTPALATANGFVEARAFNQRYGNYLILNHGSGVRSVYAHLLELPTNLAVGDAVTAGDPVAKVGTTGMSTGPHLHFEIWSGSLALDPQDVLARQSNWLVHDDETQPETVSLESLYAAAIPVPDEIAPPGLLRL